MKKIIYLLVFIFLLSLPALVSAEGQYAYTIEYYYDGQIAVNEPITSRADWGSLVISYPDKKRDGYMLSYSTIDAEGLTISDKKDYNVIKVFYVTEGNSAMINPPKTGISEKGGHFILPTALLLGILLVDKKIKRA